MEQEIVEKVRQKYHEKSYRYEDKIDQVRKVSDNPEHKVKIFQYCSWNKEKVKIVDLGTTLPHAIGLPPEEITGSLPEVVDFVKDAEPDKYESVKYINSLKKVPEVLNKFYPTVIHPGEVIRRKDRMNKVYGNKDWNIKETWEAIHNANHRTTAKILANNLNEIQYYVGRSKSDKIYEHLET